MKTHTTFIVPRHPADKDIPDSIINMRLPSGMIVTIVGPIFSETMGLLHDTLLLWKEAIVVKEDYSI